MKSQIHRLTASFVMAATCSVMSACGIDTFTTLVHDPVAKSSDTKSIQFAGPASGDSAYLGVEIFYRIYASSVDAETDRAYVVSRQSAENTVPGSIIKSYLTAAAPSGLNYLNPVLVSKPDNIPTLLDDPDLNSGDLNYYVNIAFPTETGIAPKLQIFDGVATDPVAEYELRRNVTDAGTYKSFIALAPSPGDADYRSNSGDVDTTYFVQFFAASYGIDFTTFNELYGDAVFLGFITIEF